MATLKCAIYCRLSRDDGTIDDSSSIQTQKEALSRYAALNNFEIYKIYVDDGISGTHDNRPGFQEMIRDADLGCFQVLLTKDLSRLARNYLQAGFYMEEFFPKHHIRYIAVNDNYDSFKDDNEFAPFKNIINEWYAKDISKKVKYAFNNMKKQGKIPSGTTALFGYVYDKDKNRIIDPEAADVIRKIFNLYLKLQSSFAVKKALKEEGVYCPGYYLYLHQGINKAKYEGCCEEEKTDWSTHRLIEILRNREYKGDLVLSKTHIDKIGSNHEVRTKKEDMIIFENKFEPIISQEVFDVVQKMLDNNKIQRLPIEIDTYKSLFICSHCGMPLKFNRMKKNGKYEFYYYCRNEKCEDKTRIRKEILDDLISSESKRIKDSIINHKDDFIKYAKEYEKKNNTTNDIDYNEINKLKDRQKQIDIFIEKLINGNIEGKIPDSTYNTMLQKYKKEHDSLKLKINQLIDVKPSVSANSYLDLFIDAVERLDVNKFNYEIFTFIIDRIAVDIKKTSYFGRKYKFKMHYKLKKEMVEGFINELEASK